MIIEEVNNYLMMSYLGEAADMCQSIGEVAEFTKKFNAEINNGNFDGLFQAGLSSPDTVRLAAHSLAVIMTIDSGCVSKKLLEKFALNVFDHVKEMPSEIKKEYYEGILGETVCFLNNTTNRRIGLQCVDLFDQLEEFEELKNSIVQVNGKSYKDARNLKNNAGKSIFG